MFYKSLDSVINTLQKYEEYLSKLVISLQNIIRDLEIVEGEEERLKKFRKVEERLSKIRITISNYLNYISSEEEMLQTHSKPLIVRCKNWPEFKNFSLEAQLVSFLIDKNAKYFQVNSLKDGKIFTYSSQIPKYCKLLKAWISKELSIEDRKVVEGALALE